MKCKACEQETDKETTKIILAFSISNPESVDVKVENKYSRLSMELCMKNKKQLHELLDIALDKISTEIFSQNARGLEKNEKKQ